MPIRPPALDDRQYQDLVNELIARIPAHTPEWTNPRTGDPGRTLIDLFAWLGDALLYRANLIPERQRLVFLRLLGQQMLPARPAAGLVTVTLKQGVDAAAYKIAAGAGFVAPSPFEASDEFTALPLTCAVFYKRKSSAGEVDPSVQQALSTLQNSGNAVNPYFTTQLFQAAGSTASFDIFGDSQDRAAWLAILAPKAASAAEQLTLNASVVQILGGDGQGERLLLNVGFIPGLPPTQQTADGSGAVAFDIVPTTDASDGLQTGTVPAGVPHVWEAAVKAEGETIDADTPWRPRYLALDEIADTTQGLTRPGVLRIALPRGGVLFAPPNDLRTDINAGVGDRPPRVDDKTIVAQLIGWIRLRPRSSMTTTQTPPTFTATVTGSGLVIPQISSGTGADTGEVLHLWTTWLGVNAVAVEQRVTRKNIIIGQSDGSADQEFSLPAGSVEAETLLLFIEEDSGWTQWSRVDDLTALDRDAAASRDARVFQLDAEAGTIRFGDGVRGLIPGAGRRVLVGQMRSCAGSAGNLPPGSIQTVTAQDLTGDEVGSMLMVTQPLPLTGGADAETLADAEQRIPGLFRHNDRVVTADDYRTIAAETPGVSVARVEILPQFKPQQRIFGLPGIVSVMVLPQAPLGPAPNPRADRPFLEAVYAWLDGRRPIGTELYVIGCEYVPVVVSVAVAVADGAAIDTTLQAVKDAIARVLWPLQGGGFDGRGWRLGRTVSNRELAVEVARTDGISEVNGVNLFQRVQQNGGFSWKARGDARDGKEQTMPMSQWQLPELLGVIAVAENSAPLGTDALFGLDANPFADASAVAVPVASGLQCTCGQPL